MYNHIYIGDHKPKLIAPLAKKSCVRPWYVLSLQISSPSGIFNIELRIYANQGNNVEDGSCCDNIMKPCTTSCQPYFQFTFNGQQGRELKPNLAGTDLNYSSNSDQFSFGTWRVSMS